MIKRADADNTTSYHNYLCTSFHNLFSSNNSDSLTSSVILLAHNYDSNIRHRAMAPVHRALDLPSFLRQHSPVSESHELSGTRKMAVHRQAPKTGLSRPVFCNNHGERK
jgi:hypothetical protein